VSEVTSKVTSKATIMIKTAISLSLLALSLNAHAAGGNVEVGRELATKKYACVSCHGEGMNKPIDPSYPNLAGQYPDYIAATLRAYQRPDNPVAGRNNPIMAAQAKPLTPQEIRDISAYIGSLPRELVNRR